MMDFEIEVIPIEPKVHISPHPIRIYNVGEFTNIDCSSIVRVFYPDNIYYHNRLEIEKLYL